MLDRRRFMVGATATLAVPFLARAARNTRMPTLFFAHGAPSLATDHVRGAELENLVANLPARPRGIVAFTPHVRAETMTIAAEGVALRTFPRRFLQELGDLAYTPPPAVALANDVRGLLGACYDVSPTPHEAVNHTVWMGLIHMFPAAEIPVVEVAIPFLGPTRLFELGTALAPLRDADVLIISSGSLTHNLATLGVETTPRWARDFDQWLAETLAAGDLDQLFDWRQRAPAANIAHPDDGGHFNVLMYALGAAVGRGGTLGHAETLHAGWQFGSFSKRDYVFI